MKQNRATVSQLIVNKENDDSIIVNFTMAQPKNTKVRHTTMEGKQWLVAPMVMAVEGVLVGNAGAIYYPARELGKNLQIWNHKPVVVYHPTAEGKAVSATHSPEILDKYKVGMILNAAFDGKRLTAEGWIEESRVKVIDPRVHEALVTNKGPLELSIGVFVSELVSNEEKEFNGKKYTKIATDLIGDHLAILPDKTGACSVEDGAGFIRNELGDDTNETNETSEITKKIIEVAKAEVYTPIRQDNNKVVTMKDKLITKLIANHGWKEEHRAILESYDEGHLAKLVDNAAPAAPAPAPAAPPTLEAFIAGAPAELRDVLQSSIQVHEQAKQAAITTITAHEKCKFTKEHLATKPLAELQGLADMIATPVAPVVANQQAAPATTPPMFVPAASSPKPPQAITHNETPLSFQGTAGK